jgi:hypothetical protein
MDLSKLPKLSNTQAQEESESSPDEPPVPVAPTAAPPPVEYRSRSAYGPELGADVWVNVIIGLLLIAMGFTFARFLAAKITGQPFHTGVNWTAGPNAGQEVDYFDLEGYTAWTHMGMFLFGLVMLFEAAAKASVVLRPGSTSRVLLMTALALTVATTAINLFVCVKMLSIGLLPMLSGLAVAFGGWIIADEWRMLQTTATPPPRR